MKLPCCAQLGHDLMSLEAPPSLQEPDLSATHTPLHLAHRTEGNRLMRLLMYNESVRLTVRPHQAQFIVQQPDNFYMCWRLVCVWFKS
jgi:hypothetical protein